MYTVGIIRGNVDKTAPRVQDIMFREANYSLREAISLFTAVILIITDRFDDGGEGDEDREEEEGYNNEGYNEEDRS